MIEQQKKMGLIQPTFIRTVDTMRVGVIVPLAFIVMGLRGIRRC